jgi:hypothetical protein
MRITCKSLKNFADVTGIEPATPCLQSRALVLSAQHIKACTSSSVLRLLLLRPA